MHRCSPSQLIIILTAFLIVNDKISNNLEVIKGLNASLATKGNGLETQLRLHLINRHYKITLFTSKAPGGEQAHLSN